MTVEVYDARREAYGEVDVLVNDAEAFTAKPLLDHSVDE